MQLDLSSCRNVDRGFRQSQLVSSLHTKSESYIKSAGHSVVSDNNETGTERTTSTSTSNTSNKNNNGNNSITKKHIHRRTTTLYTATIHSDLKEYGYDSDYPSDS